MGLSPMFNPLERRVLRYFALHCVLEEPIETLSQFPIKTFHFPVLERLWHVVVSALKINNFGFKDYIRPKSLQGLKQQLEDMVAMTTFHLNFGPTSQSRSMVTTLHNSASKLAQMIQPPVLHARKTVTTTITRTEVIEAEIPMQYVPDALTTTFDDVMAAPSMTQEEDDLQVEHQPSSDDFLLSLVQEEQRNHVGRVRWKTSITPQWNSWSSEHLKIDPMTSQQVKNRYYYLQNKVQHPIPNDLATIGESSSQPIPLTPVPENTTSIELTPLLATLVSIEDHDPRANSMFKGVFQLEMLMIIQLKMSMIILRVFHYPIFHQPQILSFHQRTCHLGNKSVQL